MSTAEVAILVSLLSAGLAAASLGWQVVAFRRSGYRVKCRLEVGYIEQTRPDSGGPMTTTLRVSPQKWSQSAALRARPGQHFFVTVTNAGRAAVWVDSIGLTAKGGVVIATVDSADPGLPYRLDSHQTQRWDLPVGHAAALVLDIDASNRACTHGSVRLGDGRVITTKEGVRLGMLRDVVASE